MRAELLLVGLLLMLSFESAAPDGCRLFLPDSLVRCQGRKCYYGSVCSVLKDNMREHNLRRGDPACFCVNNDCSKTPQKDVCSSQKIIYKSECEFKQAKCALRMNITRKAMSFCAQPPAYSLGSEWRNVPISVAGRSCEGRIQLPVTSWPEDR